MAANNLAKLKKHGSVIVSCSGKSCSTYPISLYKDASKKSKGTIILSVSKAASQLLSSFKKKSINPAKFMFIDAVDSSHQGEEKCQCIHIGSSESLTTLSMALKKSIKSKKFDLIIIDSISSILLYNKDVAVAKFIHDIIDNLRDSGVKFVAIIQKKDLKGPLSELELVADLVMDV